MKPFTQPLFGLAAWSVACAAWLGLAAVAMAQESTPPAATSAIKSGVSRVVVRALVDGSGTVQATQIRESSGNSRLDEEALQVVSKVWKFSPLKINGKGIEVWVNVPINFVQAEVPAPQPVPAGPVLTEPPVPAAPSAGAAASAPSPAVSEPATPASTPRPQPDAAPADSAASVPAASAPAGAASEPAASAPPSPASTAPN